MSLEISSLCTPATIYLSISFLGLIFLVGKVAPISLLSKVIFIGLWTWFLNFLCTRGWGGLSWFLVLLPWVFLLLSMLVVMDNLQRPYVNEMQRPYINDIGRPYVNDVQRPYVNDVQRPYVNDVQRPYVNDVQRPYVNDVQRPYVKEPARY